MKKNRKKKIVIIVLVVLFCLIIFFINARTSKDITENTIDSSNENTTEVKNEYDFGTDEYQEATTMKLQKVQGIAEYYTVLNCVNKFYGYYSSIYDSTSEISPEDSVSKIYKLLDEKYIKKYNLTEKSLKDKLNPISTDVEVNVDDMLYATAYGNISVYLVSGQIREKLTNEYNNFNILVVLDSSKYAFSLYLEDYIKEYGYNKLKEGDEFAYNYYSEITSNEMNGYVNSEVKYADYVEDMMEQIHEYMLYQPEKAYELLEDEFKKENFSSYDKFEKFIEDNKKEIFTLTYGSYTLEHVDGMVAYRCIDKTNKFTILIQTPNAVDYMYSIIRNGQ